MSGGKKNKDNSETDEWQCLGLGSRTQLDDDLMSYRVYLTSSSGDGAAFKCEGVEMDYCRADSGAHDGKGGTNSWVKV